MKSIKTVIMLMFMSYYASVIYSSPVSVSNGGTELSSATAYGVLIGGTSSTNPFQVVTYGAGSDTKVLTSQGASAAPTFESWFEYAYIYSRTNSSVTSGSAIPFPLNGLMSTNISHSTSVSNTEITINRTGTYWLEYEAATTGSSDGGIAISVNGGAALTTSVYNSYPSGYTGGQVIISITSGDVIRVVNSFSTTMNLSSSRVSAAITIIQIA